MHYVDYDSSYGVLDKIEPVIIRLPFDLANHRDFGRFQISDLSTLDTEKQSLREEK